MIRQRIHGPRSDDLVSWSVEVEDGMEFRTTMGGSAIPIAMRPPTIILHLDSLTELEAMRAIDLINMMRGGQRDGASPPDIMPEPEALMTMEDGTIQRLSRSEIEREMQRREKSKTDRKAKVEPERPLNRFEGLDL